MSFAKSVARDCPISTGVTCALVQSILLRWHPPVLIGIQTKQSLHPGGKYYPEGRRPQEEGKGSWRPIGQADYVHVMSNEDSKLIHPYL